MKHLMRRLSRVADSSQYKLLRSDSPARERCPPRRIESCKPVAALKIGRSGKLRSSEVVPQGHVPVYVGDEMERFVVSAELLNHPAFVELLNKAAQVYGYDQQGVLRIPCGVVVFERVLETLRFGHRESGDLQDLIDSLPIRFLMSEI